jgi:hypothetical protein
MANFTRVADNVVIAIRPDSVKYVEPVQIPGVPFVPGSIVPPSFPSTDSKIVFKDGSSVVVKEEFVVASALT